VCRFALLAATVGLIASVTGGRAAQPGLPISLTLIPPGPVTDRITIEARAGVRNTDRAAAAWELCWYLDTVKPKALLARQEVHLAPGEVRTVSARWATQNQVGRHRVRLVASAGDRTWRAVQPLEVRSAAHRSTDRLAGAWAGIYHWSEKEGRLWNPDIKRMTDAQWRELVRAMHRVGMDIVVIGEAFRNQMYVGKHTLEKDGYRGRAFYPSRLYPGRMEVAAQDPFDAILSEADRLGMHVFLPVGLYAWFDYTAASLAWHQQVATELWELYGRHPSFYGWYVVEEIAGNLGENDGRRREIVDFFRRFQEHVRRLAPDKPVLLASNCHRIAEAGDYYRQLLSYCDILCPFGFHRMPAGDLSGHEAARRLQKVCDETGAHLWMDLEVFLFDSTGALHPRPISGLLDDLRRFSNFETILCYQFPGLMTAPGMSRRLGGEAAVRLYLDYEKYFRASPDRIPHSNALGTAHATSAVSGGSAGGQQGRARSGHGRFLRPSPAPASRSCHQRAAVRHRGLLPPPRSNEECGLNQASLIA